MKKGPASAQNEMLLSYLFVSRRRGQEPRASVSQRQLFLLWLSLPLLSPTVKIALGSEDTVPCGHEVGRSVALRASLTCAVGRATVPAVFQRL